MAGKQNPESKAGMKREIAELKEEISKLIDDRIRMREANEALMQSLKYVLEEMRF